MLTNRWRHFFAIAGTCLVPNLVQAQSPPDVKYHAPAFVSSVSGALIDQGDASSARFTFAADPMGTWLPPDGRVGLPMLSQADTRTSALLGGGVDSTDKPAVRFGGFFDALPAYTYSSPTHWSRAVARLQLTAQGELADQVKWKLGARVDVDPVYFDSNFYLDPVKKNQRFDAFYRENYLDFSAGDWDFRLGAQQIVWGEVVGLFFADVVSALDEREFLLPSFDIIRIPQVAARAEYTAGDSHLELIWIPIPAFDNIGKPGADFYPARLPSPTPSEVAARFEDPVTPSRQLNNSSYGVRANTLVAGWDVSAFYYRSLSRTPTFYTLATDMPGQLVTFQPRYDRIWQIGGTVTKDFSDFVLRAETVYTHGQGYSVIDPTTPQGVVIRPTLDYIVSAEWALPGDTRVNVQGFQRMFFGGSVADFALKSDGFGASVFVSTKLTSTIEPQILWVQNFKDAGGMVRPRVNWSAAKNTTAGLRCRRLHRPQRWLLWPIQQSRSVVRRTPLRFLNLGGVRYQRLHKRCDVEQPEALLQRIELELQQHRGRAHALAERLAGGGDEPQDARIEGDMARVDFDEYVGDVMDRSPHGMGETEKRREHGFGVSMLREGETRKLAYFVTLAAKPIDHISHRQPRRASRRGRPNPG